MYWNIWANGGLQRSWVHRYPMSQKCTEGSAWEELPGVSQFLPDCGQYAAHKRRLQPAIGREWAVLPAELQTSGRDHAERQQDVRLEGLRAEAQPLHSWASPELLSQKQSNSGGAARVNYKAEVQEDLQPVRSWRPAGKEARPEAQNNAAEENKRRSVQDEGRKAGQSSCNAGSCYRSYTAVWDVNFICIHQ